MFTALDGAQFDREGYIHLHCAPGGTHVVKQEVSGLQVRRFATFAVSDFAVHEVQRGAKGLVSHDYHSVCVFAGEAMGWKWAAGQVFARLPVVRLGEEPSHGARADSPFPTPFAAAPARSPLLVAV